MPHEQNNNQNKCRYEMSSSFLLHTKNDTFLDRIVSYDEKRVLLGKHRRLAQWVDSAEASRGFPKLQLQKKKVKLSV